MCVCFCVLSTIDRKTKDNARTEWYGEEWLAFFPIAFQAKKNHTHTATHVFIPIESAGAAGFSRRAQSDLSINQHKTRESLTATRASTTYIYI